VGHGLRGLLAGWLSLALATGGAGPALASPAGPASTRDTPGPGPTAYVNPFSGTDGGAPDFGTGGGAANTSPAAVVPFGMAQWGPDSLPSSTNQGGGYAYRDHLLRGFSLTHISGAGCAVYQDVRFLPATATPSQVPVRPGSADWDPALVPSFSHAQETAQPGYYGVVLSPGASTAITSELTATTRTGFGRFTYPAPSTPTMLINAGSSARPDSAAGVQIDPAAREVTGSAASGQFCHQQNRYRVYFAARFDRPFSAYGTWQGQALNPGATSSQDQVTLPPPAPASAIAPPGPTPTAQAGAYVSFDTGGEPQPTVQAKVGLSYVSVAEARRNLDAEDPGWDFQDVRSAAASAWNALLQRAAVSGGSQADTDMFYTALYHALLEPHVFSDASGSYAGMDGQVHGAPGYIQYADYSGWDIYRTEVPLLSLLAPERAGDMMQSLVADAQESGCLPRWPVANGQTNVMVGDSADPILAGADAFGARRFDRGEALMRMVLGATKECQSTTGGPYVERPGLSAYLRRGYVPAEENTQRGNQATATNPAAVWGSAATTLEYATDDFAIAQLAARLGDRAAARAFLARSHNWRHLFHATTGHIQQRSASGRFRPDRPASGQGFVEGSGAQYSWAVPHDLAGLFAAMGRHRARRRLDQFLSVLNAGPRSQHAFLGNEPTLEAPWEYDWLGAPYQTQLQVRRALLALYNPSPTGYPGNDDLGTMSSWYLFAALGLYPEIPGTDVLALGSPLFPHAVLHLARGDLTIDAPRASRQTPFVHGLTLNGRCVDQPWLRYAWLAGGGHLAFALATTPDRRWGTGPGTSPPSGRFVNDSAPRPCGRPPR